MQNVQKRGTIEHIIQKTKTVDMTKQKACQTIEKVKTDTKKTLAKALSEQKK